MTDRLAVVDASALGALLFGEPRAEEVARRLDRHPLVAPPLLRYELSSIGELYRARLAWLKETPLCR